MPRLQQKKIVDLKLPSFDDGSALLKIETPATTIDFENIDPNKSQVYQTAQVMANKIKKWNLTDMDDKDLEITPEVILQLPAEDFAAISMAIGLDKLSRLNAIKKNP